MIDLLLRGRTNEENGLAAVEVIVVRQSGCSSLSRKTVRHMAKGRSHCKRKRQGERGLKRMSDIIKTQRSLAIKAKHNPTHKFDHLYRLICQEEWIDKALRLVLSNQGARTAGIDGVTKKMLDAPQAYMAFIREVQQELREKRFRPAPVRRIYIPKANGKMRPLGIPMVRSYCPPYGKLSGLCCQGGSDQPIHPGSTVAYFACVDENLVVSNDAEPACGARR
jgi:hypothetical protein